MDISATTQSSFNLPVSKTEPSVKVPVQTQGVADIGASQPKEGIQQVVDKANQALWSKQSNLQFVYDKEINTNVVKIVDTNTKEVIRQIPSETMVELAKSIDHMQKGFLFQDKG